MAMYRFFNNSYVTPPINYTCRVDSETGTIIGENGQWAMNATPNKSVNHNGVDGRYIMFIADDGYQFNYFDLASGLTYEPFIIDELTPSLYRVFLPYYTGGDDLVEGTITTRKIEEPEPEPDPDPVDPDPVDPDPVDPDPVDPDPDWQTLEVPEYDPNMYLDLMLEGLITLTVNGETVNVVSGEIEEIIVDKNEPLVVEVINNQLNYIFDLDDIEFEYTWLNPITAEYETVNTYPSLATPDLLKWEVTTDNWDQYIIRNNTMSFLPFLKTTVRPDQPETVDLPFSRYYKVSEEALKEIDQFRFSDLNADIDYTQYITSLRRYPFKLEAGEDTQILLGDQLLNTTGEHINEFTYRLDLGKIRIPQTVYGDVGFKNVTVELFTPYHNKITLDTDEVLNETISLSMIINLTNGDSTLNVKNERNNTIIHSVNAQLGLDIPYSFNEQVNITKNDSILFNEINECYVEIKSLIPSNSVSSNTIQVTVIDRYTGFIKTDLNKMISNSTQLEQQEIRRLLSGGVYLNGQFQV